MTTEPAVLQACEFTPEVIGGVIAPAVRQKIAETIRKADGKRIRITLAPYTKKRSHQQNNYWFGALDKHAVPTFREYGDTWSSWKLHEYIMNELGYQEILVDPKGKLFVSRKHSSEFSTIEWEEFMERAREFLIRVHGIKMPMPNEADHG